MAVSKYLTISEVSEKLNVSYQQVESILNSWDFDLFESSGVSMVARDDLDRIKALADAKTTQYPGSFKHPSSIVVEGVKRTSCKRGSLATRVEVKNSGVLIDQADSVRHFLSPDLSNANRVLLKEACVGLNAEQRSAFFNMCAGGNVFLTGDAGTGKSFVLNRFIDYLDELNASFVVMAPTGLAALNLKYGATIHRALGLDVAVQRVNKLPEKAIDVMSAAQFVIVDEISMCRVDIFESIVRAMKKSPRFGDMRLIVIGDFCQLPPVVAKREEKAFDLLYPGNPNGWCFKSQLWDEMNFQTVCLKKVVRQNEAEYLEALNKARYGDGSCLQFFKKRIDKGSGYLYNSLHLCAMKYRTDQINREILDSIAGEEKTYKTITKGFVEKSELKAPFYLNLKVGARVMCLANIGDGICNGTMGTVKRLLDESVSVEFDNGTLVEMVPYTWNIYDYEVDKRARSIEPVIGPSVTQIPLRLAYALTIHKSQGQTFDSVVIEDPSSCFCAGQLYVALSRCSNIRGLKLGEALNPNDISAADDVLKFYSSFDPSAKLKMRADETARGTLNCADEFIAAAGLIALSIEHCGYIRVPSVRRYDKEEGQYVRRLKAQNLSVRNVEVIPTARLGVVDIRMKIASGEMSVPLIARLFFKGFKDRGDKVEFSDNKSLVFSVDLRDVDIPLDSETIEDVLHSKKRKAWINNEMIP